MRGAEIQIVPFGTQKVDPETGRFKESGKKEKLTPEEIERGRKRRKIEMIEEIRRIGEEVSDPWDL